MLSLTDVRDTLRALWVSYTLDPYQPPQRYYTRIQSICQVLYLRIL